MINEHFVAKFEMEIDIELIEGHSEFSSFSAKSALQIYLSKLSFRLTEFNLSISVGRSNPGA